MHPGHGIDAPVRLIERLAHPGLLCGLCLQVEHAAHKLEAVLNAMVDLFDQYFSVTPAPANPPS